MESFDTKAGWQRLQKAIHNQVLHTKEHNPTFDPDEPETEGNGNLIVGIDNAFMSHSYDNGILRLSLPDELPADVVDLSACDLQFLIKLYTRLHAPENNYPVVHIKSAGLLHKANNRRLECRDAIGFLLYFAKDLITVSLVNWENNDVPNTHGPQLGPLLKPGKLNKKMQYSAHCQPTDNQA